MSADATAQRLNWPILLGFWALIAAVFAARSLLNAADTPLFADTDDAMRLTVVRDFLAGQNWYDNVQHRLNTPFGAEIHWSRLVDLPLGALLLVLRPLAGSAAETILAYLWPTLLLFVLLWLSAKLTLRLTGREGLLPALILPALSPALMAEFAPGRLDHHSIQIILTLAMAWCAVEAIKRPRFAIAAGILSATALAIGTEAVPAVAAAILGFGLLWVLHPARVGALRAFGLSFAAAALVHLALASPPSRWLTPACDALSITYVLAAVLVGAAFAALSFLPSLRPILRLAAAAAAGIAVLGILLVLFPDCVRGPYAAVDPWLVDHWIGQIVEAKPLWESVANLPPYSIAVGLPPIAALVVVAVRVQRGDRVGRGQWLVLGLFLAVAVVVMLAQVRGARLAAALAIPPAAWLIAAARARYLAGRSIGQIASLVCSWLLFAGIALVVVVNALTIGLNRLSPPAENAAAVAEVDTDKRACLMPAAFADLRGLPPERIMTPIDLGAHMLMEAPHSVVAAPYHRNGQGVRAALDFFNLPMVEARKILDERDVGLVVVCPQMAEIRNGFDPAADSFVTLLKQDALPRWLVEQTLPGAALRVFVVLREP